MGREVLSPVYACPYPSRKQGYWTQLLMDSAPSLPTLVWEEGFPWTRCTSPGQEEVPTHLGPGGRVPSSHPLLLGKQLPGQAELQEEKGP